MIAWTEKTWHSSFSACKLNKNVVNNILIYYAVINYKLFKTFYFDHLESKPGDNIILQRVEFESSCMQL